ncbi:hypothetical protein [Acidisphaera sp. L21]|uniref:hypothetical protein n=1 Tax=Acidisphaera sp. L21 TaxID=1641851 RepID=UPI001C2063F4|nr:hypothetical protein [Acidisphaera sp. L21]
MRAVGRVGSLVMAAGLAGCVLPPPLPPPPIPLVALPGPGKTEAQFQGDDGLCRNAANTVPRDGYAAPPPGARPPQSNAYRPAQPPPQGTQPADTYAGSAQAGEPPPVQVTPGMVYLRCMADHQNIVQPMAPARPVLYGYYPAYPVYAGFGGYYPWLYGDAIGFGFYGGWGGGWGGYRGGWGGGGYRGGWGGRGGFRR